MMIHIVVVDDELLQRQHMVHMIESVCQSLDIQVKLASYESGESFLFALEDHPEWDLAFLDIEMKSLNGMEVAQYIRDKAPQIRIAFATAYAEYAIEGYQVNALDFLLKPIQKQDIQRIIEKYLAIKPEEKLHLMIEDIEGNRSALALDQLIAVEVNGRQLSLTTTEGSLLMSGSLAQLKEKLPESFVSPHRSYLVNLDHVDAISKQEILMSNGNSIPLSRRLAKEIQQAYIQHYQGGNPYA